MRLRCVIQIPPGVRDYRGIWEYACLSSRKCHVRSRGWLNRGVSIGGGERRDLALVPVALARELTIMATSYPDNVSSQVEPARNDAAGFSIKRIELSDLSDALRLGWEDFKEVPSHAVFLCMIYPVLGLILARAVLGNSVLPLLFPLAAGFACSVRSLRWVCTNSAAGVRPDRRRPPGMRSRYCARLPLAPCSVSAPCCLHCS